MCHELPFEWEIAGPILADSFDTQNLFFLRENHIFHKQKPEQLALTPSFHLLRSSSNSS